MCTPFDFYGLAHPSVKKKTSDEYSSDIQWFYYSFDKMTTSGFTGSDNHFPSQPRFTRVQLSPPASLQICPCV